MSQDLAMSIVEKAMEVSKECIMEVKGEIKIQMITAAQPLGFLYFDVPVPEIKVSVYGGTKRRLVFEVIEPRNVHSHKPTRPELCTGDLKLELNKDTITPISNYINNILQRCFEIIEVEHVSKDEHLKHHNPEIVRPFMLLEVDDKTIYHRDTFLAFANRKSYTIYDWIHDLYWILMNYEV